MISPGTQIMANDKRELQMPLAILIHFTWSPWRLKAWIAGLFVRQLDHLTIKVKSMSRITDPSWGTTCPAFRGQRKFPQSDNLQCSWGRNFPQIDSIYVSFRQQHFQKGCTFMRYVGGKIYTQWTNIISCWQELYIRRFRVVTQPQLQPHMGDTCTPFSK